MKKRHAVLTAFRLNVRRQRDARKITQEELAEKASIHPAYIGGIEHVGLAFRRWLIFENLVAVVLEKYRVRFGKLNGPVNDTAFVLREVLFQGRLWEITLEACAEHDAKLIIQRNQTGVKRSIVETRQA